MKREKLRALRLVVGDYAVRRLREGRAILHRWRRTTPHNVWISPIGREHQALWHSTDRDYPDFSMFELVEDSGERIEHHPMHRDGGAAEHSTYRLKQEYLLPAKSRRRDEGQSASR